MMLEVMWFAFQETWLFSLGITAGIAMAVCGLFMKPIARYFE